MTKLLAGCALYLFPFLVFCAVFFFINVMLTR